MRFCLSLGVLLLVASLAFGQMTSIRGVITDSLSKPLSGATIRIRGTNQYTASKEDGSFELRVAAPNPVLQVSYTGYSSIEIRVQGTEDLRITLNPATGNLSDVIVISALGLTRKARSTPYASQSVNATPLTEARDVNLTNSLSGKVAGIQVTTTGQPGSSTRVILRGDNSLTGSNQPLWVVDGIPVSNNAGDQSGNNLDYGNGAQDLNPDDIESIEILKGPNAAALYGSRAGNGAILITTKKGKIGDKTLGMALNQNYQQYKVTEWPEYQNVYGEGSNGRLVNNNSLIVPGTGAVNMGSNYQSWGMPMLGQPYNTFSGQPHGYYPQPNNVENFYQTPYLNTTNFSIGKADANSAFRASYTFTKGNDVVQNINLKTRHNLAMTVSRKLNSKIMVDARLLYTNDNTKNRMMRNITPGNPLSLFIWEARSVDISTFYPYMDANGNSLQLASLVDAENPYWSIFANSNQDQHHRIIGGPTLTVDLAKGFTLRGILSGDLNFGNNYVYQELGGKVVPKGFYSNGTGVDQNWQYEAQLIYNKKLTNDLTINGVVGASINTFDSRNRGASINSLLVHNMPSISNTTTAPTATESWVRSRYQSVYASATLGFRDYLYFDVTGRNDWASTLPTGNNAYFYPSFGGSFVFSEFLHKDNILNYGKIRASWARVGNAAQPYQLVNTYALNGFFGGNPYLSYTQTLKNPNLKPEQIVSREIGTDLSFFKDRIRLNATAYQSNTTNQIITVSTPWETGYTARLLNAGEIQNRGIEITLGVTPIRKEKFSWNLTTNFSTNDNKVVSLVPGLKRVPLGGYLGVTIYAEAGMPYGTMRGNAPYKVGDTILVGANGRTIADPNVLAGIYRPKWVGSVSNSFRYGRFDLSVLLTVKWGGNLYSASYGRAMFAGTTVESLQGRDAWLLSYILGESGNEQRNIGQNVGGVITRYLDSARSKGLQYPNAYLPKTDANGNLVYDKNGRLIPGQKSLGYVYPQLILGNDKVVNDVPSLTYDASSIRISEVIFGYTLPQQWLSKAYIKSARIAFVGRNLWQIFQKTPLGIDPESANTSGNAQGIESGGSYPYAQYGLDLKVTF